MMKRFCQAVIIAVGVTSMVGVGAVSAASLAGKWSGTGIIHPIDGQAERARCQIVYIKVGESSYSVKAKCASTSGKASQVATVRPVGKNTYSGSFFNAKHNATGEVSIKLNGNTQTVSMTSSVGRANMKLKRH